MDFRLCKAVKSPAQALGIMILQHLAVALAPADGQAPGGDQRPALFVGGNHIAVEIAAHFGGFGGVVLDACAGLQPQGQSMGGLEAALLHLAQLQTGAQDLQALQVGGVFREPPEGGAEEGGLACREPDVQGLGEIQPLFGELVGFGGDQGGLFIKMLDESGKLKLK